MTGVQTCALPICFPVTIVGGGNTIVVVTHEEDIALYSHRIVRMRDGLIETDKPNLDIHKADTQSVIG